MELSIQRSTLIVNVSKNKSIVSVVNNLGWKLFI